MSSSVRPSRRLILCALGVSLAGAGLPGLSVAQTGTDLPVWVVSSDRGEAYQEALIALRNEWPGVSWRLFTPATLNQAPRDGLPRMVVTLGSGAYRAWIDRQLADAASVPVPVVAGLLPRTAFETLRPPAGAQVSGVWLDPPVDRYLELIRRAMPDRLKVGVIFGPTSRNWRSAVVKAAYDRGFELIEATVSGEDLYPALAQVLRNADVLLALPDSVVYNVNTFNNVLIASYRQRVPLVSYATSHVKAGATLALHATPSQAGRQIAAHARRMLAERRALPPQPASDGVVTVNEQVARSLGLSMDDPATLSRGLMRPEGRP